MNLRDSYLEIKNKIPRSVNVLAVSKLQSIEKIKELYSFGHRDFAENYLQEAQRKKEELVSFPEIRWHFIGNIQSKKIKDLAGQFSTIHSVCTKDQLQKMERICIQNEVTQKVFLQINLSGEPTKGGFSKVDFEKLLQTDLADPQFLTRVQVVGLMTMPPLFADEKELRKFFSSLRLLRDQAQKICSPIVELSMGTSHDYQVAIEEGATWIRLGTLLFGERTQS